MKQKKRDKFKESKVKGLCKLKNNMKYLTFLIAKTVFARPKYFTYLGRDSIKGHNLILTVFATYISLVRVKISNSLDLLLIN